MVSASWLRRISRGIGANQKRVVDPLLRDTVSRFRTGKKYYSLVLQPEGNRSLWIVKAWIFLVDIM